MSTTLDEHVARAYAGAGTEGSCTLFCMQMGLVDRGAMLSWLSQCVRSFAIQKGYSSTDLAVGFADVRIMVPRTRFNDYPLRGSQIPGRIRGAVRAAVRPGDTVRAWAAAGLFCREERGRVNWA